MPTDPNNIPTYPLIFVTWSDQIVWGYKIRVCTGTTRCPKSGSVEVCRDWYNNSGETEKVAKECEAAVRKRLRKRMECDD